MLLDGPVSGDRRGSRRGKAFGWPEAASQKSPFRGSAGFAVRPMVYKPDVSVRLPSPFKE
jgi:hypothetical protein